MGRLSKLSRSITGSVAIITSATLLVDGGVTIRNA